MFPSADTVEDAPPKQEQTVMRQAAELLEEALREAGGSMDEIGTNPLFSAGGDRARSNEGPPANRAKAAAVIAGGDDKSRAPPGRGLHPEATSPARPERGRDGTSAESIEQPVVSSKPPRMYPPGASTSAKGPSSPKVVLEQEPTSPGMRQALRARVARSSDVQPGKKKGPMVLVAVAALAAVAVAILMFGKSFFGEATSDAPRAAAPSDQAEPSTPPSMSPVPMVAAPLPPSEDAQAVAPSAGSASRPAGSAVLAGTASASTVQATPPSPAVTNAAPKPAAAAPAAPARPQPPPSPPAAPARPQPPPSPAAAAQPAKPRGAAPASSEDTDNPY
jgi:hypothetical protein